MRQQVLRLIADRTSSSWLTNGGRERASAVSAEADGGEGADLVLGQGDVHRVALDTGDRTDRDGDLLPSPEVAALEDEVRDVLVRVDHEAVHLAERMAVRGGDGARPPHLDLALRPPR